MAATNRAQEVKNDTKLFITTALIQLLQKESLNNLSISKVATRAGVSRMAFYRNFDSLEQVLYEHYQPHLADVFQLVKEKSARRFDKQLELFDTFSQEFLLSYERGFEPIIQQIFIEEMNKFYTELDPYRQAFLSAGVYAIWRKWLLDGKVEPLSSIHELLSGIKI